MKLVFPRPECHGLVSLVGEREEEYSLANSMFLQP